MRINHVLCWASTQREMLLTLLIFERIGPLTLLFAFQLCRYWTLFRKQKTSGEFVRLEKLGWISLSFFSLYRIVKLAKKVDSSTFSSIMSPCLSVDDVEQYLDDLVEKLPVICERYLGTISSIPLEQGIRWDPTWKSFPSAHFILSTMERNSVVSFLALYLSWLRTVIYLL